MAKLHRLIVLAQAGTSYLIKHDFPPFLSPFLGWRTDEEKNETRELIPLLKPFQPWTPTEWIGVVESSL